MSLFLEKVLQEKEQELALKKAKTPWSVLEREAAKQERRPFRAALSGGQRIIAEIKKKSPRVKAFPLKGSVEEIASMYASSGAAAISIVTDEVNFGTSLKDVERVRKTVSLPVLVKDFMKEAYPLLEARAAGADAVLLIARILETETLASLLRFTLDLGISALVECHDEKDIQKAALSGAEIIGINNRDLSTLSVSLDRTPKLLPFLPKGALSVSESGIQTRAHVENLADQGVDAFLIGGALLSAPDPGKKLKELHGLVKEGEG
jgi:indole-3-glycerol phosphate synthase